MVTIITLFFTINEASDVKKRNIYYGTEIQLENENIKSDSITTYIGQTKGYIYLYNKKEKKSISIPRDRVVKLILKRK
jgi:GH18 family chitinase